VTLTPDAPARAAIAGDLGLIALKKLRFDVTLTPLGKTDWQLDATLGATVVQPCVATLVPVTTRLDGPVVRRYLAEMSEPSADEVEVPEDDSTEPLPKILDLAAVMIEALALALPDYPRAPDAPAQTTVLVAPPGAVPLTDDAAKPLAGLAALRDKLQKPEE
jgi:uncharacterized metal-binding protein YceD (DUF177 family)